MDTYLSSEIARHLGTSIPRVQRAIKRLELNGQPSQGGHVRFTAEQLSRLRRELGVNVPIAGLSATEVAVLAALARAPLGVSSIRALAGRGGLSPTAASHAVERLLAGSLVTRETRMVAAGNAQALQILRVNVLSPRWPELAPALSRVAAPQRQAKPAKRVPRRLRHIFWNTSPQQMQTATAGGFIARRLISSGDLEGLAWGATYLAADDWRHAATTRGLEPQQVALARNLAVAAPGSKT
jgi:DNA-binding MarR family transcriptional regulator